MTSPEPVLRGADGPNRHRRRADREFPDWVREVERQERSFGWLARHTGKSPSAVSRYAHGTLPIPADWLADARRVLGMDVAA